MPHVIITEDNFSLKMLQVPAEEKYISIFVKRGWSVYVGEVGEPQTKRINVGDEGGRNYLRKNYCCFK